MKNQDQDHTPTPEDRATDGLLREHARHQGHGADEDFLASLETQLDGVDREKTLSATPATDRANRKRMAAAFAIAACAVGGAFLAARHYLPQFNKDRGLVEPMITATTDSFSSGDWDDIAKRGQPIVPAPVVPAPVPARPQGPSTEAGKMIASNSTAPVDVPNVAFDNRESRVALSTGYSSSLDFGSPSTAGAAIPLNPPIPGQNPTPNNDRFIAQSGEKAPKGFAAEISTLRGELAAASQGQVGDRGGQLYVDYDEARDLYRESEETLRGVKLAQADTPTTPAPQPKPVPPSITPAGPTKASELDIAQADMERARRRMIGAMEKYALVDHAAGKGREFRDGLDPDGKSAGFLFGMEGDAASLEKSITELQSNLATLEGREGEALVKETKKLLGEQAVVTNEEEALRYREAVATRLAISKESLEFKKEEEARFTELEAKRVRLAELERQEAERYARLHDNPFRAPVEAPFSTFSIDVDTASYSNVRRMIGQGQPVPANSVRIEEFINYFDYNYPQPDGGEDGHPFSVTLEATDCPWNAGNRLVRVGLKGQEIAEADRPSANIVFLLDVSGSMNSHDKLPFVKQSMYTLLEGLGEDDVVSIVVYASQEGLCLPPTDCGRKEAIRTAIQQLKAGGSTNGEGGIKLAYKLAREQFVEGGVNRVVLCTDGDFNVGISDKTQLVDLVKNEANHEDGGVFLTVCGYGQGNLNDAMLEGITNDGNGNYFYVDSAKEGERIFGEELAGTLVTIAKDVKIQVEFNPAHVGQYRLIGYANRMLRDEDFANDKIDAGEIGSGHTVTALYEIVPAGKPAPQLPEGVEMKYQKPQPQKKAKAKNKGLIESDDLLTVKLRYKEPDGDTSTLLEVPLVDHGLGLADATADLKFASSVAGFGMWLRNSQHAGLIDREMIVNLAEAGKAGDKGEQERRAEFIELVRSAQAP